MYLTDLKRRAMISVSLKYVCLLFYSTCLRVFLKFFWLYGWFKSAVIELNLFPNCYFLVPFKVSTNNLKVC